MLSIPRTGTTSRSRARASQPHRLLELPPRPPHRVTNTSRNVGRQANVKLQTVNKHLGCAERRPLERDGKPQVSDNFFELGLYRNHTVSKRVRVTPVGARFKRFYNCVPRCHLLLEYGSAGTKLCRSWVPVGWVKCTVPVTRDWGARSPSRFCLPISPGTPRRGGASSTKRGLFPR